MLTENFEIQNFLGIYGSIYSRTPPKCSSPSYKTAWCYLQITYQHPPLYFESSLIGPTRGLMVEMWAGVLKSAQQGKWRVQSQNSSQFLGKVQGRESTQLWWIFPFGFCHQNARQLQRKIELAGQSGKKGNLLEGNERMTGH